MNHRHSVTPNRNHPAWAERGPSSRTLWLPRVSISILSMLALGLLTSCAGSSDGSSHLGEGADGASSDGSHADSEGNETDGVGSDGSGADGLDSDGSGTDGSGSDGSGTDGSGSAECVGSYTPDLGEPIFVAGNPATCSEAFGEEAILFRVDPALPGTYTSPDGRLTVTVTMDSEAEFSFSSNTPVCGVTSKGGPAANVYVFEASTGADGLVAPDGLGISHIDFCYGCQDCESDCPPDYELLLSSEGEYRCAGPPTDGSCPSGYELDLQSEGELCVKSGT